MNGHMLGLMMAKVVLNEGFCHVEKVSPKIYISFHREQDMMSKTWQKFLYFALQHSFLFDPHMLCVTPQRV